MPTYLIERVVPGAGALSADELRVIARQSNEILAALGPDVRWLHSYVVDERIYCLFEATGVAVILEHARCMGIPADAVSEVRATISPATGGA